MLINQLVIRGGKAAGVVFFWLSLLSVPVPATALDVPVLRGHVNDYAGLLAAGTVEKIESDLTAFEKSDSTQVVLLTISSLEGDSLEDFSIRVAESWKIGQKGKDNGVILLVAKQERKIRIEVGRGLEGKLTDLQSGSIIRREIAPRFKTGDYDGGLASGAAAIQAAVRGEYSAAPADVSRSRGKAPSVPTMLIFLLVACVVLGGISRILGGIAGAVGVPVIGAFLFPGLAFGVLALLGVAGFMAGLIMSFLFGSGGRHGGFGGGPFIGGGSFGGGDGGFSGGGGDFGGGGASGDW
jgi:uncharacterized protein